MQLISQSYSELILLNTPTGSWFPSNIDYRRSPPPVLLAPNLSSGEVAHRRPRPGERVGRGRCAELHWQSARRAGTLLLCQDTLSPTLLHLVRPLTDVNPTRGTLLSCYSISIPLCSFSDIMQMFNQFFNTIKIKRAYCWALDVCTKLAVGQLRGHSLVRQVPVYYFITFDYLILN